MEMQLLSSVWRGGGERGETEIDSGLAVSQHQQDDSLLPLSERVTRSVALPPFGCSSGLKQRLPQMLYPLWIDETQKEKQAPQNTWQGIEKGTKEKLVSFFLNF